jgi:hypothetical protein
MFRIHYSFFPSGDEYLKSRKGLRSTWHAPITYLAVSVQQGVRETLRYLPRVDEKQSTG